MQEKYNWYAIYTRPKWEKKVSGLLTRKKIENFCPLNKIVKQWSDRRKTIYEPLFTSYVFVRLSENDLVNARHTEGVLNFVYWLGKIAVVKDDEIEAIREFLSLHEAVKLERIDINIRDNVRIINGPLKMMEGEVHEIRNRTVKLYLPCLGYMMMAEVEKSNIELIKPDFIQKNVKAS